MARRPKLYVVPSTRSSATAAQTDQEQVPIGDVASVHPDLEPLLVEDYRDMRDCAMGASQVKRMGERYLPMPDGYRFQSDGGTAMYTSYMKRAQFPEIFAQTISGMMGVMHQDEAAISGLEEGSPLAYLWEQATPDGLTLESLHRAITQEILTLGRVILVVDVPADGGDPYIALYKGETLINWSEKRDFFVLKEEYRIRSGFTWNVETKYRVLELVDGQYVQRMVTEGGRPAAPAPAGMTDTTQAEELAHRQAIERGAQADRAMGIVTTTTPTATGGRPLDAIPIIVAGSRDLSLAPDEIPLAGVARSSLALYRLDADYRHALFMSGQDTLFVTGIDQKSLPKHVGAGVAVALPKDAKAEYVGVGGNGLDAMQKAMADERDTAAASGARVFDVSKRGAESGDALRIRARASSATITSIALCSAAALEGALRMCAAFKGEDPEAIVVEPNLDFLSSDMTPQDAVALMELWMSGAISYETFYENLRRGGIASQERTAEEEQELAAAEQATSMDEEGAAALGMEPPPAEPKPGQDDLTDEDLEAGGGVSDEELAQFFDPSLLKRAGIPAGV